MRFSFFSAAFLVAAATGIVIACGSSNDGSTSAADGGDDGSSGGGGDATAADGAGGGGDSQSPVDAGGLSDACGPMLCGQAPGACGTTTDGCGNKVTCGLCKYDGEAVVSGGGSGSPIGLALGKTVAVAYTNAVAVRTAPGSWSVSAGPPEGSSPPFVHLAEDANGQHWVTYRDNATSHLMVAHATIGADASADAGVWTTESAIGGIAAGGAIAIGPNGEPVAASAGVGGTGKIGITLARRSAGTWTEVNVATFTKTTRVVALAMNGADPYVVYGDPDGYKLMFAHATSPTTFATEVIDPQGNAGADDSLSIAVDAAGDPHVAYRPGDQVMYAVRKGGVWSVTKLPQTNYFISLDAQGPVRIALAPSGAIAIGSMGHAFTMITNSGAGWFAQEIVSRCSTAGGFDMAYDASSVLTLAHSCAGAGSVSFLTQKGMYPAGYFDTCTQVAGTLCTEACNCPKNGQGGCCVNKNGANDCLNGLTGSACADYFVYGLCGDATQDPGVITTCSAALPGATCEPDGGKPGLELPSVCPPPP